MSASIRVLLADDSVAVRHMVTDTLSNCPDIEVVGAARDGQEALTLIAQKKPDVVLLDVEMPVMDGIDTLRHIRRTDRKLPVLMFSSLTVAGAEATLDALALGASDYVAKPTGTANVQEAISYINAQLVPRIRDWAGLARSPRGPAVRIGAPPPRHGGKTDRHADPRRQHRSRCHRIIHRRPQCSGHDRSQSAGQSECPDPHRSAHADHLY